VFVRRRGEVVHRALSKILDEESWSPATPRRLRIGASDASSRGWTMVIPELANFFLDRGGLGELRLCRLARELRCPAYEVDVRGAVITLYEVDDEGRLAISESPAVGFGALALSDDIHARIAQLGDAPGELADYLGAIAGFPAWTRFDEDAIAVGELTYEPPRIIARARTTGEIRVPLPETREAIEQVTPRAVLSSYDRRGRRPRSVSRSRR